MHFVQGWINSFLQEVTMHIELWLMHRSCVPASCGPRKAFTLASLFPPSHPMQMRFSDVWVSMFELSMGHAAPPTHCPSHQLQITAEGPSRHGIGRHPAVAHPQPCARPRSSIAGPWRGFKISWALCIRTPSNPSGVWQIFWRPQAPSQRRGEPRSGFCCCLGRSCKSGLSSHGLVCRESLHNTVIVLVHHRHNHPHHGEPGVATRCY